MQPQASYSDYTHIDTSYPEQINVDIPQPFIVEKGNNTYFLYPQAQYKIGALVGRKKRYRFDKMASISPIDLALFWGPISYADNMKQLSVRQNKRRYYFFLKRNATLSVNWVYVNSSNNHIIPANSNIRRALNPIRRNDTIYMEGYLVNVSANIRGSTYNWKTSTTRKDRGDGACEIIYVTKLKRNYQVYE